MRSNRLLLISLLILGTLSACTNTNNFFVGSRSTQPPLESPSLNTLSSSPAVFKVTRALKSNSDPAQFVDILGDQSGLMGQVCSQAASNSNNSQNQSQNTCKCLFSYTKRNGSSETWESPIVLLESNLIRCSYNGVPPDGSGIRVKVILLGTENKSTEVAFPLLGPGSNIDSTQPLNYVLVKRIQFKDVVYIPNYMSGGGGIYDPFLSEDESLTYPFNFFTTNLGGTLSQFVAQVKPQDGAGFIGPANASRLINPYIYSIGTNQTPKMNNQIYPLDPQMDPQNEFDRNSFYLAREKFGVFNIPFNTFVAPGLFTSETAPPSRGAPANNDVPPPPPIGYAAAPFRTGVGEESCPSLDNAIPKGYYFVKAWQFRATLPLRTFTKSTTLSREVVSCYPGNWTIPNPETPELAPGPTIPDCGTNGISLPPGPGILADRVDSSGNCSRLTRFENGSSSNLCSPKRDSDILSGFFNTGAGCTQVSQAAFLPSNFFAPGTDIWQRYEIDPRLACGIGEDRLNLCHNSRHGGSVLADNAPYDNQKITKYANISIDAVSRYDIVYVVTPKDIMSKHFSSLAQIRQGDIAAPYVPYTFYSANDCPNPSDPDSCPSAKKRYYAYLNTNASEREPATDLPPIFPLCVLQKVGGESL